MRYFETMRSLSRRIGLLVLLLTPACAADGTAGDPLAAEAGTDSDAGPSDVAATDGVSEAESDAPADPSPDVPSDSEPDETADSVIDAAGEPSVLPDASEACQQCSAVRPIILVHGINGGPENFDVMAARLLEDGWPAESIVRFEAEDPAWGCNVDNAAALSALVDEVLTTTCQPRLDIVAHSMGTLSSRYYLENLGGTERVNTYVTLGGMHHGLFTPCLAPDFLGVCVWLELCESGDFIADLNAEPATPGELHWVSIYGTADTTVPNTSSHLDGAENIAIEGAEHDGSNGLLQRADAYAEVRRVLGYACW